MENKAQVVRNELLTVEELVALLKVSPKTIYAWR
jgi:DNA-binding XRE family transcriptional regulator|tara:strand:+ start:1327 stop:1428 length:102 start_codon:yes stop_codon:yes gene_type:complete